MITVADAARLFVQVDSRIRELPYREEMEAWAAKNDLEDGIIQGLTNNIVEAMNEAREDEDDPEGPVSEEVLIEQVILYSFRIGWELAVEYRQPTKP